MLTQVEEQKVAWATSRQVRLYDGEPLLFLNSLPGSLTS